MGICISRSALPHGGGGIERSGAGEDCVMVGQSGERTRRVYLSETVTTKDGFDIPAFCVMTFHRWPVQTGKQRLIPPPLAPARQPSQRGLERSHDIDPELGPH